MNSRDNTTSVSVYDAIPADMWAVQGGTVCPDKDGLFCLVRENGEVMQIGELKPGEFVRWLVLQKKTP